MITMNFCFLLTDKINLSRNECSWMQTNAVDCLSLHKNMLHKLIEICWAFNHLRARKSYRFLYFNAIMSPLQSKKNWQANKHSHVFRELYTRCWYGQTISIEFLFLFRFFCPLFKSRLRWNIVAIATPLRTRIFSETKWNPILFIAPRWIKFFRLFYWLKIRIWLVHGSPRVDSIVDSFSFLSWSINNHLRYYKIAELRVFECKNIFPMKDIKILNKQFNTPRAISFPAAGSDAKFTFVHATVSGLVQWKISLSPSTSYQLSYTQMLCRFVDYFFFFVGSSTVWVHAWSPDCLQVLNQNPSFD